MISAGIWIRIVMGSCAALVALGGTAMAATIVDYQDSDDTFKFDFNGDAGATADDLILTDAESEASSVFTDVGVLDTTRSFKARFEYVILQQEGPLGDGMTFSLLRDGDEVLGVGGSGLGYEGLPESFALEIDIFSGTGDPSGPHLALLKNGDISNHLVSGKPRFALTDDARFVWLDYKAAKPRVSVYISKSEKKPKDPILTKKLDLGDLLGESAFVGFTGATGDFHALQRVASLRVTQR
jgi:hypothetical protein